MRRDVWAALLLMVGCGESPSPPDLNVMDLEPTLLLEPSSLVAVSAEGDPLADHRPRYVDCPPATWGEEGGGFEVQTGACNYAAFNQPLSVALEAGDMLAITVWHDFLDAAEPATAHVAVLIGDAVVWEREVDIPAPSAALEVVVPIEKTPSPQARLGLHLHNHGFNSWRFISVDAYSP